MATLSQMHIYEPVAGYFDGNAIKTWYKHLSGEHHLASSFALWLAARILKSQNVPAIIRLDKSQEPGNLRNILIVNHYKNIHHSPHPGFIMLNFRSVSIEFFTLAVLVMVFVIYHPQHWWILVPLFGLYLVMLIIGSMIIRYKFLFEGLKQRD